jgi:hypothetical protein
MGGWLRRHRTLDRVIGITFLVLLAGCFIYPPFAAFLVLTALHVAYPPVYFARDTHLTVVDAKTRAPIEGVVVVAQWETMPIIGMHGNPRPHLLAVQEAVSAADGRVTIPGWGPKLRWPPFVYMMDLRESPSLTFFHPRYGMVSHPDGGRSWWPAMIHDSTRNSSTVAFDELGDFEQAATEFRGIRRYVIRRFFAARSCAWTAMPHLLRVLDAESRRLSQRGMPIREGFTFARMQQEASPRCPQVEAVIREKAP